MKKTLTVLTIAGTLLGGVSYAQEMEEASVAKLNTWSIGAHIGNAYLLPSNIIGSNSDKLSDAWGFNGDETGFDLAYGLYVEKQISPIFGLQLGFDMGSMTGQSRNYLDPNNSDEIKKGEYVNIDYTDVSLRGTINFTNFTKKRESSKLGFYGKLGAGVILHTTERGYIRDLENELVNPRKMEDAKTIKADAGLGLRYFINSNFRIELESSLNVTKDGDFDGDLFAGYDDKIDMFQFTSLGVAYTFGKGKSMNEVSKYSKENFWNNGIIKDNSKVDEDYIKDVVNKEIEDEVADILATKKKMAELEKELAAQKALLDQLKNQKTKEASPAVMTQVFQVFYATASDKITMDHQKELTVLAELMNANPKLNATLTGFTDKRGKEGVNKGLRMRRAESVKNFLVNLGVNADRLSTTTSTQNIIGDNVDHLNRKTSIKFN